MIGVFASAVPPAQALEARRSFFGTQKPASIMIRRGLLGQVDAVALAQLLAGQGRAEVGIVVADQAERPRRKARRCPVVRQLTLVAIQQAGGAVLLVPPQQAQGLARRQSQSG